MNLFAVTLAASAVMLAPSGGAGADELYRPLSKAQFEAFDAEYWQLSSCQKAFLSKNLTPDVLAARLIEKRVDGELISLALRILPTTDQFASMLRNPTIPQTKRIAIAMAGLGIYAAQDKLLPSQGMRAFGVVRKYTAVGISPACQPSPKFLSTLKVMLDADF